MRFIDKLINASLRLMHRINEMLGDIFYRYGKYNYFLIICQ